MEHETAPDTQKPHSRTRFRIIGTTDIIGSIDPARYQRLPNHYQWYWYWMAANILVPDKKETGELWRDSKDSPDSPTLPDKTLRMATAYTAAAKATAVLVAHARRTDFSQIKPPTP